MIDGKLFVESKQDRFEAVFEQNGLNWKGILRDTNSNVASSILRCCTGSHSDRQMFQGVSSHSNEVSLSNYRRKRMSRAPFFLDFKRD